MKKTIKYFVLIIMAFTISLCGITTIGSTANAELLQTTALNETEISEKINTYLAEFSQFSSRAPGTEGEKQASEYIFNKLSGFSGLSPKKLNGIKDEDGIQNFTFTSRFDGKLKHSQNIIFEYKTNKKDAKKIILACSYDGYALDDEGKIINTEAINGSAGSVAVLLALAENIASLNKDINYEFIFFGAGSSSNAGATHYSNGLSEKDSKNILLMMNIENIALGKNLYFYVDETKTELSDFAKDLSGSKKLGASEVNVSHLGKILLSNPSDLGLNYKHIANSSANEKFMKANVLSMNVFAGDYSEGIVSGKCEYANKDRVLNTKNDNLEYISKNYGENVISQNLSKAFSFINELLISKDLAMVCENSVKQVSDFYAIAANQKLPLYLTICALFVGIIVALLIHYRLSVKAFHANIETEFASSVISISENFDFGADKNEVSKIVGQVVAHDIKKDKRIKRKKNKKQK